jgi:phosphatidylglycerol---prolipoprotein diacylglyceryl transferase
MIPFFPQPVLRLGPLTIHAFGAAVAVSVLAGLAIARPRFERAHLSVALGERFATWLIVGGIIGAHLFSVLFYFPEKLARDPLLLFRIWEDISSFGAMLGGLTAAALFLSRRAHAIDPSLRWKYLDVAAFSFPFSLMIGRVGCALAHDHPGTVTTFPLAISLRTDAARALIANVYGGSGLADVLPPDATLATMGFHDLGVYEMLYLLVFVLPVMVLLDRRPRHPGFFLFAFLLMYLPVRFGLDFLRLVDERYIGLTPAQWVAGAGFLALPLLWTHTRRRAA